MNNKNIFLKWIVMIGLAQFGFSGLNAQELYRGQELANENPTGNACYLYIDTIAVSKKGKHCYDITVRPIFGDSKIQLNNESLILSSRVTNYHRKEYPQIKTCATRRDGNTSLDDIYGDDTSDLVTPFFSTEFRRGRIQYSFFVTLSGSDKKPTRTRLHQMTTFKETDIDCVNLTRI